MCKGMAIFHIFVEFECNSLMILLLLIFNEGFTQNWVI